MEEALETLKLFERDSMQTYLTSVANLESSSVEKRISKLEEKYGYSGKQILLIEIAK